MSAIVSGFKSLVNSIVTEVKKVLRLTLHTVLIPVVAFLKAIVAFATHLEGEVSKV